MLSIFFTILFYDDQNIRIVKLDSNLEVEWTEEYGECDGSDQLFDFVVDRLVSAKKGQKEEKYKKKPQQRRHCDWWSHSCWSYQLGLPGAQGWHFH